MSDLPSKNCWDCGELKSAAEFWKRKDSKDGLAYYCKPCFKVRNTAATRRRAERNGTNPRRYIPRQEAPEGMKYCLDCETLKSTDDFVRYRGSADGLTSYCKPCHTARGVKSKNRTHGSTRDYHLKRRYGLTSAEVTAMIKAQMGVCAICLTPGPEHVDHDHKTGRVRAILCFNCNGGLGQFKDRPDLLRRGADYLEGNVWKPTLVAPGVYRLPS
ncbi:endonuclease VII domain-containing protein [Streptacidiphilus sp. EB103A]|uniref:endonuclease VII domain-containing protein n=1 Tax=Streptacidiphilus sp. EB103A TaxID=3156275 RepID=UPI0035133FE3